MKKILLFGAGKSATALIDYFLKNAAKENWFLTLIDSNLLLAKEKIGTESSGAAVSFDITDEKLRAQQIGHADLVISLLPPTLHLLVAKDCLRFKKHLLTASYIDAPLQAMKEEIGANNLLFLCEMGLDPGIDHMSAKKLIDSIHKKGGKITSFLSHCGGLVAPESDDNPWHYKISWNPRNVVTAGKAGAYYRQYGQIVELEYKELFSEKRYVTIPGGEPLCWYPNRDSLSYINNYGLADAETFIRTTLRHPDYMYGWKNIIDLQLTNEQTLYDTDGLSLALFFKEHMDTHGFSEWLEQKLREQFDATKKLLAELVNLVELEQKATEKGIDPIDEFMMVDDKGELKQIDIDELKVNAAATVADRMHDASLTLKQLFYLGMDDTETLINKGKCSAADVLQFALEKKMALKKGDKDMVVMLHEIEYLLEGEKFKTTSTLIFKGDDEQTAMAKTVGLPLGIAAKLILNGAFTLRGLHIPVLPEIYQPVLAELNDLGIHFHDQEKVVR